MTAEYMNAGAAGVIACWATWCVLSARVRDGVIGKALYAVVAISGYAVLARSERFVLTPNAASITLHVALALAGLRHMFMATCWPAVMRLQPRPPCAGIFLPGDAMQITEAQLQRIMPLAGSRAAAYVGPLNVAITCYGINTLQRVSAFLAQVGHESGQLQYVRELGSDTYLARYDTGPLAQRLGNTPDADGDGQTYRGRGLIQVTGHANYLACSLALFGDRRLLDAPDLLEQPHWAALSAGWYWSARRLNRLADVGDLEAVTRTINGGLAGLAERRALYDQALKVLA
jgi:putative chitinase